MKPSTVTPTTTILPLSSQEATLTLAGGKGANLARLKQAGFPIPDGFLVTTLAYQAFVAENNLEQRIKAILPVEMPEDPTLLESISTQIRSLFTEGKISSSLAGDVLAAYAAMGRPAVAVRSSATAEDLPEMSFAGQQDTYLNVVGEENLLQAVINCWVSLWTARAIGYRLRNRLSSAEITLAVVVQRMVESQASGVLFTANPLTGLRTETVIEATLGLGEALVSGQVQPDHYVVDTPHGQVRSKTLGSKSISIHGQPGGGTHISEQNRLGIQALADAQILELARLGSQVADLYKFPQDVEWAWAQDAFFLLQARPITSLFPLPEGMPPEPLKVMFSFAAVQGMLDPLTPLGRDTMRELFSAGARLFGTHVTRETQTVLFVAGERLWVNFTPILSNSFGRRVVPVVLGLVEPTIRQAVTQIQDDPRLQPGRSGISLRASSRLARFFIPMAANLLMNLIAPQRRRKYIIGNGERVLHIMEKRCAAVKGDRWQKLAQQSNLLPEMATDQLPRTFILFVSIVAAGMASWNILNTLATEAAKGERSQSPVNTHDLVLQVTRGMPNNPTTEMDLTLWEMARTIQSDPASYREFRGSSAAELSGRFLCGDLPEVIRRTVLQFLDRYGGRGLGEIDLGRKRWAEDPTHVFEMLASFLQIEDETHAPDVVFAHGVETAEQAVNQLVEAVRRTRRGWIKARLARFFAGRARQLMGARESPKFFAVRMMWLIHRELLKTGQEFVRAGELDSPDDLFYLSLNELKGLASRQEKDWRSLISRRRESFQRELLRRQIPRLLMSDGRAFYEGMNDQDKSGKVMSGSPVSPGRVEGKVRVVFDPGQAGLLPGEILVCPGTDPSWTPLFLSAAGLVMEVGGMMTHGAVVAREYGIPAIVGVDQATRRLQTGQRIRLDGSTGQITMLDQDNNAGSKASTKNPGSQEPGIIY
jgi:phosphohistidine swiveling domain-containing protein